MACSSLKTPERGDLISLKSPQVIGQYPVYLANVPLWAYFDKSALDSAELKQATHFQLELSDNKKAIATLYNGKDVLKTQILNGKLKDGYFRLKHRIRFSGVPILLWGMKSEKMQFGTGSSKQLYIDQSSTRNGAFLFFVAGTPDVTTTTTIPLYQPYNISNKQ